MITTLLVILSVAALFTMRPSGLAFALAHLSGKVFCDIYAQQHIMHELFVPFQQQIESLGVGYYYFTLDMADTFYYISSGCFDLLVISTISVFVKPSKLAGCFIVISVVSLMLNFSGWLLWFYNMPPLTYNIAFIALYVLAIYILLRKDLAKNATNNYAFYWPWLLPHAYCEGAFIRGPLPQQGKERRR